MAGALLLAGCGSSGDHASAAGTSPAVASGSSARPIARTNTTAASSASTSGGATAAPTAGAGTSPAGASGSTTASTATTNQGTAGQSLARSPAAGSFAPAYAEFLDGQRPAGTLPVATDAARAQARAGGPIPRADRHGALHVVSVRRAPGSADVWVITARDRAHTFYASITVGNGGARVVGVQPPDYAQVLAPPPAPPPAPPAGSAAAERAARAFLTGYLAWQYGHGPVQAITGLTGGLRAYLQTNHPRVPPAERRLHPRIAALPMQHTRYGGWRALALVFDGQLTYELVIGVRRIGGRWLVSTVGLAR